MKNVTTFLSEVASYFSKQTDANCLYTLFPGCLFSFIMDIVCSTFKGFATL